MLPSYGKYRVIKSNLIFLKITQKLLESDISYFYKLYALKDNLIVEE